MRNLIRNAIEEEARKMFALSGTVSPWRVARSLGLSDEIARGHLIELGYLKVSKGKFIPKDDRDKAIAKEPKRLEDEDISSFKVFNDMEFSNQDFIQDREEASYTAFSLNELRSIAKGKGIEIPFSMTKAELIKKLKSKLNG